MAKKSEVITIDRPSNVIVLGGEELRLVRPKGRAGRRFVVRIQATFDTIVPFMSNPLFQKDENKLTDEERLQGAKALFDLSSKLFLDENLHFEDEILPGLYVFSELGLTQEQARKKLDTLDESPSQITMQYMLAFNYFVSMDQEDREAVDEALKKSEAGAE